MPFTITLGFATEHDHAEFVDRIVPKVRGHLVEPAAVDDAAAEAAHRLGIAVTSPTAARDLCHQIVAFLAHAKNSRVNVSWPGVGGETQTGDVNAGAARDAEILAVRIGAGAKAHLDAEKE